MQCSEIFDSKKDKINILHLGKAFVTDGGKLSHLLKIIHVNVPNWNNYAELKVESPFEKCMEDIAETVKVSLEKGHHHNVNAIAIPPISTCGVGSVPLPVCGRAYVSAVTSYIDAYPKEATNKIREIYYVDTDQSKLDAIKFAFSGLQHWVFHQADNEKHFYHGEGKVVKILASEILFADAEALVAPQDAEMKSERYIAKSLKRCECKSYDQEIANFHRCAWCVGDIRTTSAPKSLKFYHILHVYSPSWRSDVPLDVKARDLRTCIKNIFKEASKLKLGTIAIPTFGGGIKDNISKQKIFKETAGAIVECLKGTPGCTIRVIFIIDSDELNIALMI
ncbi:protein mono-ADP-ribosyltransferase PARP14-like [Saccostrea echinata]|uniref:protein mono-ADP-ribosyltransferase PARP14-like n=1 Tax=Saccostrea echinata TaxID=191078 RepID=UPI002A7F1B2E|nr:protein mono-ADP-ribosyltransferase PARP14-like [Saccostrea echinata]